jgi:hypothetical protein
MENSMGKPKRRIGLSRVACVAMLGMGASALLFSVIYASAILAFIGLGLTFWGTLLLYIQTEDYVRKTLLDSSLHSLIVALNQIVEELDYKSNAVYLPPKYFEDPETTKIYVAKQENTGVPTPEEIQEYEKQLFIKNPRGILLTPPGAELARLFEKTLETSFTKVDLEYLKENLPKLLIEDLEIAEGVELQAEDGTIHIKLAGSIFYRICNEMKELQHAFGKIGCPICSAVACALTRATGSPVVIENTQLVEHGKIIETTYQVLKTGEG